MSNGLLDGLRVVDFTQVISGPYTTYLLALQGADVIKLEHPVAGDQGRQFTSLKGAFPDAGQAPLFMSFNGNKRSMTLDLKSPESKEIIHRLVSTADVVVQNFRAGAMDRLGYGYEDLKAIKPDLVYCSISGYGDGGPLASWPAYDPVIQAKSGMMTLTGFEDANGPTKVGFWVTDVGTGIMAAHSITSALFARERTGKGCHLDVSMLDTAVSMITPSIVGYLNCEIEPRQMGNGTPMGTTVSSVYPTGDGYIQVSTATQTQFENQCAILGKPDIATDARFRDRHVRQENAEALRELLCAAYGTNNSRHWEALLTKSGVPAAAVSTVPQMLEEEQIAHRGIIGEVPPPVGLTEILKLVGLPFQFSGKPQGPELPPPSLGQHTDEVMASLGYEAGAIDQLRSTGVI